MHFKAGLLIFVLSVNCYYAYFVPHLFIIIIRSQFNCLFLEIILIYYNMCANIYVLFRWTRSPMLGSIRAKTLSYSAVKLFSKYSNLCDKHTWTSQTDRQTTYCGMSTAR